MPKRAHNFRNLAGQHFYRLIAVNINQITNKKVYWNCLCECGNIRIVFRGHLINGKIRSCGCLRKEIIHKIKTTHGMSKTSIFRLWWDMIRRCEDSTRKDFVYYGGRGISVCERWHKFENFFADMGKKPDGLTLDRINNNGNYEPDNCRWATKIQQANNTSKSYHRNQSLPRMNSD